MQDLRGIIVYLMIFKFPKPEQKKYYKDGNIWTNNWFTWMGTVNKTGIRYSNRGNFNFMWKDGKIVQLDCFRQHTIEYGTRSPI